MLDKGGDITTSFGWGIALLKEYKDTSFTALACCGGNTIGNGHVWFVTCTQASKTTASIGGYCLKYEVSMRYVPWYTAGYIK